uniref:Uncharacterized protein n=1 Tax=Anguilla anguilla TaxID=7936 RepID=A0A0E9V8L7_ANGAN
MQHVRSTHTGKAGQNSQSHDRDPKRLFIFSLSAEISCSPQKV